MERKRGGNVWIPGVTWGRDGPAKARTEIGQYDERGGLLVK